MVISDLIGPPSGVDKTGKLNPVLLGAFPARGPQYTHNTVLLLFIDLFVCVRVPVYMCYDFTAPLFLSVLSCGDVILTSRVAAGVHTALA